jgi:NADH dehydrogenase
MVSSVEKARQRLGGLNSVEIVQGDVREPDTLTPLMQGIEAVIHLVAIPMERGGQSYEAVNHQGTINVVDAAKAAGVERFLNMSQNGATPDHWSRFLRSKGKAAVYVAQSGLKYTTIRPSVVFGKQDEFFNAFARLIRLTPVVFPLIGGGKAEFQPISIDDVVEIFVRSLNDDATIGREFTIGGPEVLTLGEIERRVLSAMNVSRVLIPLPVPILRPAVWVMERTLPGTPVTSTLLDLLKAPNVTPNNDVVTFFHMQPKPFAGPNIAYLRAVTAGEAIQRLFRGKTVN